MAKVPYFPFYASDWLGSRKVLLMTDAQRGIYISLMAHQWSDPSCSIPTDKKLLQKMLPGSKWKNIEYVLKECFVVDRTNEERARNARISVEHTKAIGKSEKAMEAYKHTKRYKKQESNDNQTINQTIIPPEPEPYPEPKESKEKKGGAKTAPFILPVWVSQEVWTAFEEMRKKIKKPMTDYARHLIVKKLESFKAKGHDPTDVLNNSIEGNWQKVYEPKTEGNHGSQNGGSGGGSRNFAEERQKQRDERNARLRNGGANLPGNLHRKEPERTGGDIVDGEAYEIPAMENPEAV